MFITLKSAKIKRAEKHQTTASLALTANQCCSTAVEWLQSKPSCSTSYINVLFVSEWWSVLLLCVCTALLRAVLLWARWKSLKGPNGGGYHVSAHQEDLEDIRKNILNYNEEGGGEQDQVRITVLHYN